jgi:hypothetical protein
MHSPLHKRFEENIAYPTMVDEIAPNQLPVRDLRKWLASLGENHRDPIERARDQVLSQGSIRQKIQNLECGLKPSSSSTASTGGSPNSIECDDNKTNSEFTNPTIKSVSLRPVFRPFEQESSSPAFFGGKMDLEKWPVQYRIVSIRKLLDPPPTVVHKTRASTWSDQDLDDCIHQWPKSDTKWHPNMLSRAFVLDEERTVQSVEGPAVDIRKGVAIDSYDKPCDASSYSDPGFRRFKHTESSKLQRKESSGIKIPTKAGFRNKLPLLLCKSVREIGQTNEVKPQCTSNQTTEKQNCERLKKLPSSVPAKADNRLISSQSAYVARPLAVSEDSTLSTCQLENPSLDVTMGVVFADEVHRLDCQKLNKEQEAIDKKQHGPNGSQEGESAERVFSTASSVKAAVQKRELLKNQPPSVPTKMNANKNLLFGRTFERLGDDRPIPFQSSNVASPPVVREDSTRSPFRSLSREVPMGDIFAHEIHRLDSQKLKKEQHVVPKKSNGPNSLRVGESAEGSFSSASSVLASVQKFGGRGKVTSVQKRKEELERKWAEDSVPKHTKKVEWHVSNGAYKKKVILKTQKK